jgi:hypothetical protein
MVLVNSRNNGSTDEAFVTGKRIWNKPLTKKPA